MQSTVTHTQDNVEHGAKENRSHKYSTQPHTRWAAPHTEGRIICTQITNLDIVLRDKAQLQIPTGFYCKISHSTFLDDPGWSIWSAETCVECTIGAAPNLWTWSTCIQDDGPAGPWQLHILSRESSFAVACSPQDFPATSGAGLPGLWRLTQSPSLRQTCTRSGAAADSPSKRPQNPTKWRLEWFSNRHERSTGKHNFFQFYRS